MRVHVAPDSFGHVFRDTFQWLVAVPNRFGIPHRGVQWLRWPSAVGRWQSWRDAGAVAEHYRSWVSDVPPTSFPDFVHTALRLYPGVLPSSDSSGIVTVVSFPTCLV